MSSGESLFTAEPAHVRWFGERIIQSVAGSLPARVLDIGCGDGSLLLFLAAALPSSTFVGVELSDRNVAAARVAVDHSPHRERIQIVLGDYLQLDAGRFDLLIASSSLQGIEVTSDELAAKIARDSAVGGRFIHVTPYACAYNTGLNAARKVLKSLRSPVTDRLILWTARALHPSQPLDRLQERVSYMYLILRHTEDSLRSNLARLGFRLVAHESAPHTSLGQPKHRFAVMTAPMHSVDRTAPVKDWARVDGR